jgi:hypothetical protein
VNDVTQGGASHEIEGIICHECDGRSCAWRKYLNVLRWNDADLVHDVMRVFPFSVQIQVLAKVTVVVRQIVVHHIKRISFSLAEVLRFGIAC